MKRGRKQKANVGRVANNLGFVAGGYDRAKQKLVLWQYAKPKSGYLNASKIFIVSGIFMQDHRRTSSWLQ